MFGASSWEIPGQQAYSPDAEEDVQTIDDVELVEIERGPVLKFVLAFIIGAFFFLVPVPWNDAITVPFDIVVSTITDTFPVGANVYALLLVVAGGVFTTMAEIQSRGWFTFSERLNDWFDLEYWETAVYFWFFRVVGTILAPIMFLAELEILVLGPEQMHAPGVGPLVWGTLILSVAVIVPIGAIFINLFVELGGLEFVGTLARPIMRPLFKIPGRSALDALASWVGSYSVGLYVTRNVFDRGEYSKRDVYVISTCFATVSIGFVGVVAATLDFLHLFPLIFLCYLICIGITGAILVRVPPLSSVPEEYIEEPNPETRFTGSVRDYWRFAVSEAVKKADEGGTLWGAAWRGFVDGLKLAILILGTILTVGLAAVMIAEFTPTFDILTLPLVPVIAALGIPNPELVAPATIIGITEMFIPALLVVEAEPMARFFIAILSISQLIFFSAVGPMMMDMFQDIPIRFRDLVLLFFMRTIILIPIIAAMTHIVASLGLI